MLDPVHNQGLRLCLGAFRTSVENLYDDTHEPSLGTRCAKLSLQYAPKIKVLPKHPTCDAVFDNKYMKLFHARPNVIHSLALSRFVSAFNFSYIMETPSYNYCMYQTTNRVQSQGCVTTPSGMDSGNR